MNATKHVVLLLLASMAVRASASDKLVIYEGCSAKAWLGDVRRLTTFGASGIVEIVGAEVAVDGECDAIFADGFERNLVEPGEWIAIAHSPSGIATISGQCIGSSDEHSGGSGKFVVLACASEAPAR